MPALSATESTARSAARVQADRSAGDAYPKVTYLAGTLGQGGAERQLYYQLRCLREQGSDVRLLCLTRGEFWEQPIRDLGVDVEWVGKKPGKLARLRRVIRALRRSPTDILQSAHFFTNLYVALAARWVGCRDIGALRSDAVSEVNAHGWLGEPSLRLPRLVAANSKNALATARGLGLRPERAFHLPNVVDADHFYPATARTERPFTVLGVGRIDADKRFDLFLAVIDELRRGRGLTIRARIVGDGPDARSVRTLARAMSLSETVLEFTGPLMDPAQAYRQTEVLLVTSRREGASNVVLEAMASALPVVATRTGGLPELLEPSRAGTLVHEDTPAAYADALVPFVDDLHARERAGQAGRRFIQRNHGPRSCRSALANLHERALA